MSKSNSSFTNFNKLLRIVDFSPFIFTTPTLLSLLASVFDGLGIGLLMPLLKGLIDKDFSHVINLPLVEHVVPYIPENIRSVDFNLFLFLITLVALCSLINVGLETLSSFIMASRCVELSYRLRVSIYERYLSFGKAFFDNHNLGYLVDLCNSHTNVLGTKLLEIKKSVQAITLLIIYLCIMFFISWKLTIFSLILFPIYHFSTEWLVKKLNKSSKHFVDLKKTSNEFLTNTLSSITLLKSSNREPQEVSNFSKLSQNLKTAKYSIEKKNIVFDPIRQMILLSTLCAFMITVGHMTSRTQSVEVSSILVFLYILRRSATGLGAISRVKSTLASISGEVVQLLEVFNDKDKYQIPNGTNELFSITRDITIKNLSFNYPNGKQALKNVSLSFPAGKTTALVGTTGSGKSTIINLILRMYDCSENSIFIEDKDIRLYQIQSLRSKIMYISQDHSLFNDTILNNLTYGISKKISDSELSAVLEKSKLAATIESLPNGINTVVGDRGMKLSGGEKQRIAIARGLLQHPEIIILDEATSALDSNTEKLITLAMDELQKDKTSIVIAHRLSTIKNAHQVVVLEDGEVLEVGGIDDLLKKQGKFFQLWNSQYFEGS